MRVGWGCKYQKGNGLELKASALFIDLLTNSFIFEPKFPSLYTGVIVLAQPPLCGCHKDEKDRTCESTLNIGQVGKQD